MNRKELTNAKDKKNPYNGASRLSKMFFWWMKDLFKLGLKRSIEEEDIYCVLKQHQSEEILETFTDAWNLELKKEKPSMLKVFFKIYGLSVVGWGIAFSIVETVAKCAQPLLLGGLLSYFTGNSGNQSDAYLFASGIVFCSLISAVTYHPYALFLFETAMKLNTGCCGMLYKKV